jgi:cyanoexosortase A
MNKFLPWDRQILHHKWFWLLVLTAALATIYLGLLWRANDTAHLGMSILFFAAVYMVMEEKISDLTLKSDLISQILGGLLIGWTLFNLPLSPEKDVFDPVLRLSPFLFSLGICLIASGYRLLKQYWQSLLILLFLGGPSVLAYLVKFNPSPLTAQFAGAVLRNFNLEAEVNGIFILLNDTHLIEVYQGCSGLEAMTYLLGISVIMLILFPVKKFYRIITPLLAIIIGFVTNGLRVVAMSLLVQADQIASFKYWHEGEGSLIIGMIAISIFLFYYFLLIKFTDIRAVNQSSS